MGNRPVVFIHGAGDSASVWAGVGREVERAGHVWEAPDLVDLVDTPDRSIEGYARAVSAFCDATEWYDIVLAGHSMGSLIALEVAGTRPPWLGGLVLLCTGTPMAVSPDLLTMAATEPDRAADLIAKWSHTRDFASANPETLAAHRAATSHIPGGVLASDLAACDAYAGAVTAAAKVAVPTTLIVADADRMVPLDLVSPIADAIGTANVVTLTDVGHRIQWEAVDDVAEIITAAAQR